MIAETRTASTGAAGFQADFTAFWRGIPDKALFFGLFAAWAALFHFLGNSTLGYTKTDSLFGWLNYCYHANSDDAHGLIMPLVVLVLFWCKRDQLLAVPKRHWWLAISLLVVALLLHVAGFAIQQTRVSVMAFFLGLYALMGLIWGRAWLKVSFFPFFLFVFCLPLSTVAEPITRPLRLVATSITSAVCHLVLGVDVLHEGNRIFNPNGAYQYEVAAACSGIRSLTAIFALTTIYGFMAFKSTWRTWLIILSAFPLAVAANVLRLISIIIASEVFDPAAGKFVHENEWISLLPYLPAFLGVILLGHWLREDKARPKAVEAAVIPNATHTI